MINRQPKIMTIAGSDSGGGAGVQADLKTFAANGCYGTSVFTALTAQNTQTVTDIFSIDTDFVVAQFNAIMQDIGTDTIKIGMLHRAPIISAVTKLLYDYPHIPVVLDPVMISETGSLLLENDAIDILLKDLMPLATLVTPNLMEAAWIVQKKSITDIEIPVVARDIALTYKTNVLLKGGHLTGPRCSDYFYDAEKNTGAWFEHDKIETKNTHGTGCTLAAAIAANLAKNNTLHDAIGHAINYLQLALKSGSAMTIGQGAGPVDHFYLIER